ncbi:MAG: PfkB family carbohydrate kinase [Salinibacterium sp.]|nr:PfkB family carbohydrate kinase [Salinibacterium sp.]
MGDRIICFGDLIDDVVVVPSGPIRADTDTPSSIRFRAGGSAANTAAWLAELGAAVDYVGVAGANDVARHSGLLAGVTAHIAPSHSLPTGTIVVMVDGERRSMLTERGANAALDPIAVTDAMLAEAAVLHLTGHTLLNDAGAAGITELIARARTAGVAVSVDPGSAGFVADYGVDAFLAAIAGASILLPSLEEGSLLTGLAVPEAIAAKLAESFDLVALTLGLDGVIVAFGETVERISASHATIVDPTGAGDAFTAGFLADWVRAHDPIAAGMCGVLVGARAVETIGGRPPLP